MASKNRNGERKSLSKRARREAKRIAQSVETIHAGAEGLRRIHKATERARQARGLRSEAL